MFPDPAPQDESGYMKKQLGVQLREELEGLAVFYKR